MRIVCSQQCRQYTVCRSLSPAGSNVELVGEVSLLSVKTRRTLMLRNRIVNISAFLFKCLT